MMPPGSLDQAGAQSSDLQEEAVQKVSFAASIQDVVFAWERNASPVLNPASRSYRYSLADGLTLKL